MGNLAINIRKQITLDLATTRKTAPDIAVKSDMLSLIDSSSSQKDDIFYILPEGDC